MGGDRDQPRQVYRLQTETASGPAIIWSQTPSVQPQGIGKFVVYWDQPGNQFGDKNLRGFLIEYRPPNETT